MQDKSDDSFHTKINWELELNTIIEDEMWTNICASCHKGYKQSNMEGIRLEDKNEILQSSISGCEIW